MTFNFYCGLSPLDVWTETVGQNPLSFILYCGFQLLDLRMETIGQTPLDIKCIYWFVSFLSLDGWMERVDSRSESLCPQDGKDGF